jgi:hypothetical protein
LRPYAMIDLIRPSRIQHRLRRCYMLMPSPLVRPSRQENVATAHHAYHLVTDLPEARDRNAVHPLAKSLDCHKS